MSRLRIGVPADLLAMEPASGHGKVWHRTLACLAGHADLLELGAPRRGVRRRREPDVVLADGHGRLPPVDVPLVAVIHEAGWRTPELRAILNPAFLAALEPRTERAVRAAAHVITPSHSSRADVLALYGLEPARVHTVPYGVDPVFTPGAARAGTPVPEPYVLFAAVLHPRKNLAVLRVAMARLATEGFAHRLVIAGRPAADGSDVAALQSAAAAELPGAPGRVVVAGVPSDAELAALMAGAAAYCLPSLHEGFGLTALEAMACGTPVVVADRGALPQVVGEAGAVVAPEAEAIVNALRAVLSDPELAREMSERGRRRAAAFTWERTAQGWIEVLRAAAGAG